MPLDDTRAEELAQAYQALRPRLVRVAYAVLGTHAEAEDVVSDTWLRLAEADSCEPVRDVEAWSVVAVSRRALDVLRSARARREEYVGPWLPEPVVAALPDVADVADRVTMDDEVGYALLVVLETLTPAERVAFVLHDVFSVPFPQIAQAVGRTPLAVRQLASRARAHVAAGVPRLPVDARDQARAVEAFLAAGNGGGIAPLLAVLDPDVVLTGDGGGQVRAARRPVTGADNVARFLVGVAAKGAGDDWRAQPAMVNGDLGLVVLVGDRIAMVVSLTVSGGLVSRVDIVSAPDKLATVRLT